MDLLITILLLLVCLLLSNVIGHYIPFIPTALIQIALGILLAIFANEMTLQLESEWFLLLFVAPLLYNDGRNFPREDLWRMRAPILGNAIILVLLTTLGGGYFIHWLIPDIPLAAAFALAAILSPTDPVAVNGIAKRIQIPEKILNLVRGESLINDASGLVAFKFAVAAVVTGYFSIKEALFEFTYTFLAGAILGLILGVIITQLRFTLRKKGIHDVVFHSLLQLLTPFIIYLIAEDVFHASGVIAVVVGGIIHALVKDHTETLIAEEQLITENTWSIVLFILNGVVFLLLGLNIPLSMTETLENPSMNNWKIIGYSIAIGFVILGIRFIWSYAFSYYEYKKDAIQEIEKPSLKTSLLTSLTGVRGAVTMAGVLSLPLLVDNGDLFPERSLILFLASSVILFTLLIATIFLPLLIDEEEVLEIREGKLTFNEAKKRLLIASIRKINSVMTEENQTVAFELIDEYKLMFNQIDVELNAEKLASKERKQQIKGLRLLGLKAEKEYIERTQKEQNLDPDIYSACQAAFKEREKNISNPNRPKVIAILYRILLHWRTSRKRYSLNKDKRIEYFRQKKELRMRALGAGIDALEQHAKSEENPDLANSIIYEYRKIMDRMKQSVTQNSERRDEIKEELRALLIETERMEIQKMYEAGEIERAEEKELRRFVNYIESISLYEVIE
ncbi:Na+/H+ antiporter [Viridibacillus arvi]|uniref:Sodium:proton antiporter n=1 Tax=Viridibacillus arvi TaxID=263475 RepID=A0A0M0LB47_9BACL|nr:Na+/H+ antiporter [Viridibacillus arvi]KOO48052.1 sodium:proton antiporter [Viridibacillus arvi]